MNRWYVFVQGDCRYTHGRKDQENSQVRTPEINPLPIHRIALLIQDVAVIVFHPTCVYHQ
ncbi:MAG: hypothetical protein RLZZ30_1636 [Bacteroidota bacterium]